MKSEKLGWPILMFPIVRTRTHADRRPGKPFVFMLLSLLRMSWQNARTRYRDIHIIHLD